MAYTREQQRILETMGLKLYVPVPSLTTETLQLTKQHAAFWQTHLGQNIQRLIQGHDLSALQIATVEQGVVAKRIVWQHVRALLKSV
jgi:hypothetical protein